MIPKSYVQLYSLRKELAGDYTGIINQLAEIGYMGVEPAGFRNMPIQQAVQLFANLGLESQTLHAPLPVGEEKNRIIEEALALGAKYLFTGVSPEREKDFESVDAIKRIAETYNEVGRTLQQCGIALGYHNHWWEMEEIGGRAGYQIFLEHTEPSIFWEIDTYWVKVGGRDPVTVVQETGARAPVVHLKDGPCTRNDPMVAVGSGKMEIEAILKANPHIEIAVVELDECATDMLEAIKQSYQFLVENHLVQGKK